MLTTVELNTLGIIHEATFAETYPTLPEIVVFLPFETLTSLPDSS